ncbi:hypothetical protein [Agrobacterium sp. MCAB5]|uniref:hypothetical protein n=1 Tax=Agrobacterium sp. MCAB5 TaxID=3233042 RepID=UPI003F8F3D9F
MAGEFNAVGNFVARGADKVDPVLVDILQKAADATGLKVEAFSGFRPGDKRLHGKGAATDVRILDENGKPLANYQDTAAFPIYQRFAHAAREIQQQEYPELGNAFRWGGYFSGSKGKYGAMDLMHFDVGGSDKLGMGGGSWDKGLSKEQAALWKTSPGLQFDQNTALAYNSSPSKVGAADAVNALAQGGKTPEARVQMADYVPPPGSTQQPNFTPLVTPPALRRQQDEQQQSQQLYEMKPIAPQVDNSAELLKAWGLDAGSPPSAVTTPAQPAGKPAGAPDDLMKVWGLDTTQASPQVLPAGSGHVSFEEGQRLLAEEDQKKRLEGAQGAVGAGMVGALEGVPVAGPVLRGAAERGAAIASTVINPDTTYGDNLAKAQGITQQAQNAHPIASVAGNIVGGVGSMAPVVAAAPALMGASSTASLGQNMLLGGLSGAAIGGADSAVRSGGDIEQTGKGALTGGAFGAGAPLAGKLIGAGVNKLTGMFRNVTPTGAAGNNLRDALASSGASADDIAAELARNPRLSPMDIDPNLQQMAMNLANQGGKSRSVLNSAVENRLGGAKGAVQDAFDTAITQTPDVKLYLDNLKQTTSANARKAFGDALTGAKPVDVAPVLESIDNAISPGINGVVSKASDIPQGPVEQALARVRAKLANGNEVLTDAERLHQIQSGLRAEADTLAKSASGQDKLVANALRDVRQKLITQIDDATGGKFRPAQKQFADDNAIQDAFDKGLEVFKGGTTKNSLENRPEYWADWVKNATPAELDAAKTGVRVAVDQTVSSVRNAAAKGQAIADVDFNVARLESLLGKKETSTLVQALKDEQRIAQTNAKLFAGSQTAPRQAVNKLTEVTQVQPGISITTPLAGLTGFQVGGLPGAAAGVGLSLGRKAVQAGQQARDIARNRLMAEAISGDITRFKDALGTGRDYGGILGPAANRLLSTSGPGANQLINGQRRNR